MELACKGMRVIVTAAASGIGQTIAEAFLREGAKVHICDINTELLSQFQAAMLVPPSPSLLLVTKR